MTTKREEEDEDEEKEEEDQETNKRTWALLSDHRIFYLKASCLSFTVFSLLQTRDH